MKKYFAGLVAFVIMLFPMMVNASEITKASAPVWMESEQYFIANGTPIVIEEKEILIKLVKNYKMLTQGE